MLTNYPQLFHQFYDLFYTLNGAEQTVLTNGKIKLKVFDVTSQKESI